MGLFSKVQDYRPSVGRNVFDLSFSNNLTTKFGQLTPCACYEVIPGDKFRIRSAFGLRFMPTYFPLQTRIRADVHFFYVRNRNLWSNWQRFITQSHLTDGSAAPVFPTMRPDSSLGASGSLADYLGVPTTINSSLIPEQQLTRPSSNQPVVGYVASLSYLLSDALLFDPSKGVKQFVSSSVGSRPPLWPHEPGLGFDLELTTLSSYKLTGTVEFKIADTYTESIKSVYLCYNDSDSKPVFVEGSVTPVYSDNPSGGLRVSFEHVPAVRGSLYRVLIYSSDDAAGFDTANRKFIPDPNIIVDASSIDTPITASGVSAVLPISALPFRAYESIYNSFYRDERVNPLKDGQVNLYNKWLLNDGDGVDSERYDLHFRNWEQDFLTTCVPSPQQGVAPLVGISSLGTLSFALEDGSTYQVEPVLSDDGNTIVNAKIGPDTPASVRRALVDYASSGISINDFRNVNSLQRWLESNIRRGYKYRDQIISHFGVEPRFDVMDMPEFIGGFSQMVDTSQINQTVESSDNPLGSYAGQLSCVGNSHNDIVCSCDEHGFIIGILSVVPVPTYSQLLSKYFLKSQPLDYFFPEFGHIGMQPVYHSEVFPLQSFSPNSEDWSEDMAQTFGYQRAWYDYLSKVDEVHGDFRTSLKDFVLSRNFISRPSLNASFTVVDPSQLNDVFSVTLDDDKILGQMYFDVKAVRPIPRYGIPKLE